MGATGVEAGDVLKVVLEWTLPTLVRAVNTLYWYRSDANSDIILFETMQGYVVTKVTALVEEIDAGIVDVVTADKVLLYTMQYVAGEWVTETIGGEASVGVDGLVAGDMVPHGVSALITYPTSIPGTRGRTYLPGWAETAFTASTMTAGTKTLVEAWATEYLAVWEPLANRTFVPVVLSYKSGTAVLLTQSRVSDLCAYQRRRGPGRGS